MTAELPQPQPTDAVIVGGARTPFTRLLSQQADLRAVDLGAHAITHALERAGVAPEDVDMVYMGQVVQAGAGQNPARQSALAAGIPWNVPAMTINKVCLSGLTAVIDAARLIRLGEADVVVAGGQESMTNAPHLLPGARKGFKYGPATMLDAVAWDGLTDSLSHGLRSLNTRYAISGPMMPKNGIEMCVSVAHSRSSLGDIGAGCPPYCRG